MVSFISDVVNKEPGFRKGKPPPENPPQSVADSPMLVANVADTPPPQNVAGAPIFVAQIVAACRVIGGRKVMRLAPSICWWMRDGQTAEVTLRGYFLLPGKFAWVFL